MRPGLLFNNGASYKEILDALRVDLMDHQGDPHCIKVSLGDTLRVDFLFVFCL
jgi:hypothetical protein